jgi:hypothetical protein
MPWCSPSLPRAWDGAEHQKPKLRPGTLAHTPDLDPNSLPFESRIFRLVTPDYYQQGLAHPAVAQAQVQSQPAVLV